MGFAAIKWARSVNLDKSAKALLVDLALRANDANECWPSHKTISGTLNVSKDTVERAIKRLRTKGLITVRLRYDKRGRRTSNHYQLKVGATPNLVETELISINHETTPLGRNVQSANPHDAGDRITNQSNGTSKVRREEVFKETNKRFAQTDNITSSTRQQRSRFSGSNRLPFTSAVVTAIARLGVDLEFLVARYEAKTKNRDIMDPSAYLLRMGQEEAAKALGIPIDTVKRLNSSSAVVRAAAIGSATEGTFVGPAQEYIKTLERRLKARGLEVEDMIARWKATKPRGCTTAAGAARSLEAFVANDIFHSRDKNYSIPRSTMICFLK